MESDLMTTAEVAELLKVQKRTIRTYRTRKNNRIPFTKVGKFICFIRSSVEQWIRENEEKGEEGKKKRRCFKCKAVKPLAEFWKSKHKKHGRAFLCKECGRLKGKEYRSRPGIKQKHNEYKKTYNQKPKAKKTRAEYRARPETKKKEAGYANRRYEKIKDSGKFRIDRYMLGTLGLAVKNRGSLRRLIPILGYDAQQLRDHLESRFSPGMTWENYGNSGWHIDHIRPRSSFNYTSMEDPEFKACWALENLQPLWAEENASKGKRG